MTTSITDLLILGDSFCSDRTLKVDWPMIVKKSLSTPISGASRWSFKPVTLRGQGFPGASWWSVRNHLIQKIKKPPQIAIFCHTEPNRIPHDNDWGVNFGSLEQGMIHGEHQQPMSDEFQLACELYYKHLWSHAYHEWTMTNWLYELDELTKDIEIVLHFFGFENQQRYYEFQHGVSFSDPLLGYATFDSDQDPRNHFDIATNQRFADFILEHIHNYPGAGTRIDKKLALR
jgi:hypothetical protein